MFEYLWFWIYLRNITLCGAGIVRVIRAVRKAVDVVSSVFLYVHLWLCSSTLPE
jgi:hypothetical protein